jgi:hypothetical protein
MPARPKHIRERYELRRISDDLTLNQAFQLAHSIYRFREADREIALDILWGALRGIDVRLIAQDEADRHDPRKPSKVRWDVLQWLQLLIYCKSERHEKEQELHHRDILSEKDMIVRYMKHLILATSRRNSFYVSLGLSRLLYNYSTADTMVIYDFVFQDPDASTKKADAYYRDRKNKLIEEMQKRFHQFLKISQGPRGEKRFYTHDDSAPFIHLIERYLRRFTPWDTRCELPEVCNDWTPIHQLQANQAAQIHALIHPTCYAKITGALKLAPPRSRLAIPSFFLAAGRDDETSAPDDGALPSELTQEEAAALHNRLAGEAGRRKKIVPQSLSILVDGVERACLQLNQARQVRFKLEEDATLLEIVGHDEQGELLLATHLLAAEDDLAERHSTRYAVVLERGQKISVSIWLTQDMIEGGTQAFVEARYQETNPLRAVALWWQRLKHRRLDSSSREGLWNVPLLSPRLLLVLLVVSVAALTLYFVLRGGSTEHQEIARQQPPPSSLEGQPPAPPSPPVETAPQTNPGRQPLRSNAGMPPSKRPDGTKPPGGESGSTTREQRGSAVQSLAEVKRVYVDALGEDPFSQAVRQKLIEQLRADSRLTVSEEPDDADTAVMGSARQAGTRRDERTAEEVGVGYITVELVNVSGDVIWRARRFTGTAEEVASWFTKALRQAMQREARRRGTSN